MTKKSTIFRLSDELETIFGPELYALKGGFHGADSDGTPSPTGNVYHYFGYGYDLYLDEYTYTGFDGSEITIHKAPDHLSNEVRSNCLGYALTGGEYMIIDGSITRDNLGGKFGYEECSKSEASLVVIYNGNTVSHAGLYNPSTDTYDAKGGGPPYYTRTGMSEDEFYRPYNSDTDPNNDYNYQPQNDDDVVYYKRVYY